MSLFLHVRTENCYTRSYIISKVYLLFSLKQNKKPAKQKSNLQHRLSPRMGGQWLERFGGLEVGGLPRDIFRSPKKGG